MPSETWAAAAADLDPASSCNGIGTSMGVPTGNIQVGAQRTGGGAAVGAGGAGIAAEVSCSCGAGASVVGKRSSPS